MYIKSVNLVQFRNIANARIDLSPELNFIIGRNGQGKTNLVEALHILSTGKSFRASSLAHTVGWDYSEASVACVVSETVSDIDLRVVLGQRKRQYLINGQKAASLVKFVGSLTTVSFSPDDLQIIRGGPAERRKFLDKHIVDAKPSTLKHFANYQKSLKNKNSLLKSGNSSERVISPWNQILAAESEVITRLRLNFLESLEPEVRQAHSDFGASDGEISLNLEGFGVTADGGVKSPEDLYTALNSNLRREQITKISELGVHRDDVSIRLGGKDSRVYASQGQVRSVVLSLKLGVIALLEKVISDSPVVLLDDVDSELDSYRSDAFFDLLLNQKRQVIITGTEFSGELLNSSKCNKVINVDAGRFESLNDKLAVN